MSNANELGPATPRRVFVVVGEGYGESDALLGVFVDDRAGADELAIAWETNQGHEYEEVSVRELADWAGLAPTQVYRRVTTLRPDGTPYDTAHDFKDTIACGPVPAANWVSLVTVNATLRSFTVTTRGVLGEELAAAHEWAVAAVSHAVKSGVDPATLDLGTR